MPGFPILDHPARVSATRMLSRSRGPGAIHHLQLLATDPFRGEHRAGSADSSTPDTGDGRIARAVEVVVRDVELNAPEVVARHEVGDATDRVGAVGRRGTLLQHLKPADRDRRNRVHVDETAADETRVDWHVAAAVEQHQGP